MRRGKVGFQSTQIPLLTALIKRFTYFLEVSLLFHFSYLIDEEYRNTQCANLLELISWTNLK